MSRDFFKLSINGKAYEFGERHAFLPLSELLRYERSLTGTKVVCAEGDCGACTVMMSRDGKTYKSINSCIATGILLDGCHVITVEALEQEGQLSEIQDSMVRNFGGQCGFCTPGFVMSMVNMYENAKDITEQKAKNYMTGNLCRCTGYSPILKAALDVDYTKIQPLSKVYEKPDVNEKESIHIEWDGNEFFAPKTLKEAVEYKKKNPEARVFSGATDIGVQVNKGKSAGTRLMSFHLIDELYDLKEKSGWIHVGARVSLDDLQNFIEDKAPEFANFLNIFASPQIKNAATLIGNVANGSPIGDSTPYLMTADAVVELYGPDGDREVPLVDFITGYKTFDLKSGEFITSIRFKVLDKTSRAGVYKVSQRRDLDISCVNGSFILNVEAGKIKQARIAVGGVGPKTLRLKNVEEALEGEVLTSDIVKKSKKLIEDSVTPISDARGTEEFRRRVTGDLFEKYVQEHF